MSDAPAAVTCPNCGVSIAPGRFCSACGKPLDLHATTGNLLGDTFGVKQVSLAPYGRTAMLALFKPAELSGRWQRGERAGLVSPIAMMGAVTLITAFVGFWLSRWFGARAPTAAVDIGKFMTIAPFLADRFPQAISAAALNTDALNAQFQQVGGWFAAFWPSLFIAPGWLSLAPWRRIDQRGALIFALVESIFLLILTGVHTALTLAVPGLMASGWIGPIFGAILFYHGARHVRGLIGGGWGYALTRPLLAALWILPIAYLWVVFVLTITLMVWT